MCHPQFFNAIQSFNSTQTNHHSIEKLNQNENTALNMPFKYLFEFDEFPPFFYFVLTLEIMMCTYLVVTNHIV